MTADPLSLNEIVENGLCIGCGLCRSLAGSQEIEIIMTPEGRLRPVARSALSHSTLTRINAVCPGTRIAGPPQAQTDAATLTDTVWGPAERVSLGYAGDPAVRFQASSGGVLTALGQFLLTSGRVSFLLHVSASRSAPMRSESRLSFDPAPSSSATGSCGRTRTNG